jgi:hypothetical protein
MCRLYKQQVLISGICIYIFCLFTTASGVISTGLFLATVKKDYDLEAQQEKLDFLSHSYSSVPYIDKIEFRIGDVYPYSRNVYWSDRLKYAVRLSPSGLGETYSENKFFKTDFEYNKIKKERLLNSLLMERYNLIIDLLGMKSMLERDSELATLYLDRIKVLEKRVNDDNFEIETLIEAEDQYTRLNLSIIEQKSQIRTIEDRIRVYLPQTSEIEFDTTELIEVDSLYALLCKTPVVIDSGNILLKECELEYKIAGRRYELESASLRKYISFLQFGYDQSTYAEEAAKKRDQKRFDFSKAFSLEAGISVPIMDRNDLNRRMLSRIDAKGNYYDLMAKLQENALTLKGEIQALVEQYKFSQERNAQIRTESSLQKYIQLSGDDPLIILRIRESIIRNQSLIDKIRFDVYRKYIKVIDITGSLSSEPVKNYLSKKQEVIK